MNMLKSRPKEKTSGDTKKTAGPENRSKSIIAKVEHISEQFWKEISETSATSEIPIWRMWR